MGERQSPVSHVSDTARWVATYRAWESARPDALFRDPYAARLAGERGTAIAKLMPRQARNGWPLIARTRLIDDLLAQSIAQGCRRVINLAAGLDTRPYRLALPASLQWIEVDLPAILAEKTQALAGDRPACALSRRAVDLSDPPARRALFDEVLGGSDPTLVLTEGLLLYLDVEVVRALAQELSARPDMPRWWMFDLCSPELLETMQRKMGSQMARAPLKFAPDSGVAFFESYGWNATEVQSLFAAAARWRRLPLMMRPFALLPQPDPRHLKRARWSAVVRLTRRNAR